MAGGGVRWQVGYESFKDLGPAAQYVAPTEHCLAASPLDQASVLSGENR